MPMYSRGASILVTTASDLRVRRLFRVTAIAFGLTFWAAPANGPDLGWHLLGGAWIAQHQAVPQEDFINTFRTHWHDYHWLAQLVMYLLYATGGYALLRGAVGILMAYTASVLTDIVFLTSPRRAHLVPLLALLLACLELVSSASIVRPQAIAFTVVAVALRRLLKPPRSWEIPLLFALTALLVNVHVYWIFVPLLWLLFRCLPRALRAEAPSAVHAWGGLLVLGLAGLASPYAWLRSPMADFAPLLNYAVLWDYAHTPSVLKYRITEFMTAFGFRGPVFWIFLGLTALGVRAFSWRRATAMISTSIAALLAWWLAVLMSKFVPLFAICALPYLVKQTARQGRSLVRAVPALSDRWSPLWIAGVLLATLAYAVTHSPWIDDNEALVARIQPIAACRSVASLDLAPLPGRDHVRVLTDFNTGGWCRWALFQAAPGRDFRVTFDGRTQGVPAEYFVRHYNLLDARYDWQQTIDGWNPDVLVLDSGSQLANVLLLFADRYRLAFRDGAFAVFVPSAHAS